MSEGDFFREVQEEVRREQLAKLWDRYGVYVLLVSAAIVLGVAGYKGWGWYKARLAAADGARFVEAANALGAGDNGQGALSTADKAKRAQGLKDMRSLAQNGSGGYPVLARLRLAAVAAAQGEQAQAISAYDAVAANDSADGILRGFARIQAATLRLDKAGLEEIKQRLSGLTEEDSPWRHSARELLGLAAYRAGKLSEAEQYYSRLLADPGTPAHMRQRAQMMLGLIVKPKAQPAANERPGQAETPAAGGAVKPAPSGNGAAAGKAPTPPIN